MVNDFISLSCPACGGKLIISTNTNSVKCDYCKSEHLIRREGGVVELESFAACPICHRNDKSQKISTFPDKFRPPEKPLSPIRRRDLKGLTWLGLISIIISILVCLVLYLPSTNSSKGTTKTYLIITLIFLILGIILNISGRLMKKKNSLDFELYEKDILTWNKLLDNWKRLYYCQRDDIVYDIETRKYCDSRKYETLLDQ